MKRRVIKQLRSLKAAYRRLPQAIDTDYHDVAGKALVQMSILECANGGKVVTVQHDDSNRNNTTYQVYQVRPEDNLMDILATILVEARLK